LAGLVSVPIDWGDVEGYEADIGIIVYRYKKLDEKILPEKAILLSWLFKNQTDLKSDQTLDTILRKSLKGRSSVA
jgi:hypothetical protein